MISNKFLTPILILITALTATAAWSQTATVTYSLPATVPVIGSGLLLLLGLLLAAVGAYWMSRRPEVGRTLALSFTMLGATLVVGSSAWLASDAGAAAVIQTYLLSENSSPVEVDTFPAQLSNDLDVPVELKSITIAGCPAEEQLNGTCAPQTSLAAHGGSCSIDAICADDTPVSGEVCFSSSQFSTQDPWVICDIDESEAWVSADNEGEYNAEAICQALGFDAVGQHGGTCGNVCGYCEDTTSCESPGNRTFDGEGGAETLGTTVHWTCVNNP